MKKVSILLFTLLLVISCKKESKPTVVGTDQDGKELVVNAKGDTVVYDSVKIENTEVKEKVEVKEIEKEAFTPKEDGAFTFQFNLENGAVYPFKIHSSATNTQALGKQSATMTQESSTEIEYQVTQVKVDSYVLNATYKRFMEKLSDGKESMGFDTNKAQPKNPLTQQRWKFNKSIVGNGFQMEIDKKGKVLKVSGLDKVKQKVSAAMSSELKEEEKADFGKLLDAMISEEGVKAMFQESVSYYPNKSVKKGDTWDRSEKQGNAKSSIQYTFDGVENGLANISIVGKSSGSQSEKGQQGSTLFTSLEGSVNGKIKIDKKSGWIKSAEMKKVETVRMTEQLNDQKQNMSSTTKTISKIN